MDTTTAGGELLFHIAGALAQFERRLNAERSRAGIEAARRRGKHLGRPTELTPEKIAHARKAIESGEQSVTGMAHEQGIFQGGESPRHLPAQVVDHGTGYLAAFGAMIALARRAREGGSYQESPLP